MKLWLGLFTLLTGVVISAVAAYFSIVGLVALFAASAIPVAIMGGSLEVGKIVASGWLKLNWANRNVNLLHKSYLFIAILALMLITSIGIYGFLSAGHLNQAAPRADIELKAQPLELQIKQKNDENLRLGQRLNQIDQNIAVFLNNDQASRGLNASQSLQRERGDLQKKMDANNEAINVLNTQLSPLKAESNAVEAKLGPVKFFAKAVGLPEDNAVQIVILLLMFPFDPLAVILILSAMITLREWYDERKKPDDMTSDRIERFVSRDINSVSIIKSEDGDGEPLLARRKEHVSRQVSEDGWPIEPDHREIIYARKIEPEIEPVIELEEPIGEVEEPTPVAEKEVDRDTLIAILERNPNILNEIERIVEEDVAEELTDREKLLDLLEKNPSIINDMAGIIASQITKNDKPLGDSWLKD